MANALSALVADSSQVFIMGHKSPTTDCMGAAAGVCAIARKKGPRPHHPGAGQSLPGQELMDRLAQLPGVPGLFPPPRRPC